MMIKSLHIKLSLSVAAAALFVVMLSSYFFYKRSYENSFADSERSVRQLLETVSNTAAIAAYVGNRELAQEVVAGLSINDIVVGAQIRAGDDIIGQQGKPVSDSQQTPISLNLKAPFDEQEVVGVVAVLPNLPLIALRARDSATATTIGSVGFDYGVLDDDPPAGKFVGTLAPHYTRRRQSSGRGRIAPQR
jgi:PDZ domain-containing secreted protein